MRTLATLAMLLAAFEVQAAPPQTPKRVEDAIESHVGTSAVAGLVRFHADRSYEWARRIEQ